MATPFASLDSSSPLARWWAAKGTSERRVAAAIAAIVVAGLAWWLLWQPLTRDIAAMRTVQTREASAFAAAEKMAAEIAGLARTTAAPPAADARGDLERVLAQQGLRQAATQMDWQDGRARVVFADVRFDALVAALEALQRDAQLRVVEATLTARVEPGTVRAELVLVH
jgi:general secretion pathway protein M